MRRSNKQHQRSLQSFRPCNETLEIRRLLACDIIQQDDGTVLVEGDELEQIVTAVNLDSGGLSVECRERGNDVPGDSLIFKDVSGLEANLRGGNDEFVYSSRQNVNSALNSVHVSLGDGDDHAQLEIVVDGNPASSLTDFEFIARGDDGNDVLRTDITTLTDSATPLKPVMRGEIHGGGGLDETSFISRTVAGGFTLQSTQTSSQNGTGTTEPGCVIWDLMDGETGNVSIQLMGSDADERITLESHAGGIGRRGASFELDTFGGVDELLVDVETSPKTEFLELNFESAIVVKQISDRRVESLANVSAINPIDEPAYLVAHARTNNEQISGMDLNVRSHESVILQFEDINLEGSMDVKLEGRNVQRHINDMHILDGGTYNETVQARKPLLVIAEDVEGDALVIEREGTFVSKVVGGRERNRVASHWSGVTNHGTFQQVIDTSAGADRVRQRVENFQNFGNASFSTRLGQGSDGFDFIGKNIYVAIGSSVDVKIEGEGGQDKIFADVEATLDGQYSLNASGGRGDDLIAVAHKLTTRFPRSGQEQTLNRVPSISVMVEGDEDNDRLASWLFADIEDELIDALIDGGRGDDLCEGNVPSINCESDA